MRPPAGTAHVVITPDRRAYAVMAIIVLRIVGLWIAVGLTRGVSVAVPLLCLLGLIVTLWAAVANRTVVLTDTDAVQGWPPFQTRIPYGDIRHIQHVGIRGRGLSAPALAISTEDELARILVPIKAFGLAKRRQLLEQLARRAPQARIDVPSA